MKSYAAAAIGSTPSSGVKRDSLGVWFIPFDAKNPYQRELASHLGNIGFQVNGRCGTRGLVWETIRDPDSARVIHMHWLPNFEVNWRDGLRSVLFVARIRVLRWLGCRFIWTAHNLYHHEVKSKRIDRWVARRVVANSAKVIVHSPTARSLVAQEFRSAARDKIVVVPHGNYVEAYENKITRAEAREKLGVGQDALLFLFLGNIRPYKGVVELIKAYREFDQSGTHLFVVGKPLDQSWVDTVAEASGEDKSIHLKIGFVPDEEIQIYMNACDVVVFPYRDILTSGAIVLAMSFGKPCIAPRLGCISHVLDDHGSFLYDPEKEDGLKEALRWTIQDCERLGAMGTHNLERAKDWDWTTIALHTARCYTYALDGEDADLNVSSGRPVT